jgi:transposase
VAIAAAEEPLGELQVQACPSQAEQLVAWAAGWPERAWAVEGAAGLGHLLAQQLVAAGEQVVDVPPKLAARVRLLQAGDTGKNDPNDAFSVAVAALRSPVPRPVIAEDHAVVLKIWAKRHRDLARLRNQACCRLHAVLRRWYPAGSARRSAPGRLPASSSRSAPRMRSSRRAVSWPASSSPTSAASMPSCATPTRSWPPRSGPRAPA